MELFEVSNDNETRVWRQPRYMFNTYEHLSNEDQTLADAGIFGEQLIMLEMKDKHGHWPRGECKSYFTSVQLTQATCFTLKLQFLYFYL
jgi:hypothetical protein